MSAQYLSMQSTKKTINRIYTHNNIRKAIKKGKMQKCVKNVIQRAKVIQKIMQVNYNKLLKIKKEIRFSVSGRVNSLMAVTDLETDSIKPLVILQRLEKETFGAKKYSLKS